MGRLTRGVLRVLVSAALALTTLGLEHRPAPARAAGPFLVTNSADSSDLSPGDGICAANGGCTLRAAFEEANALGGAVQIFLPNDPGPITYTLSLGSSLSVQANVSLQSFQGAGPRVIDGNEMSLPVFDIAAASVQLAGVTIRGGGQGVLVQAGAGLGLENATITDNSNTGIINQGALVITNTTISGNSGGGLLNDVGGMVQLINTTVAGNTAASTSGGIDNWDGDSVDSVVLVNSVVAGNTSTLRPDNCAGLIQSGGHNLIAYTDDTQNSRSCSFTPQTGDQVGVSQAPLDVRLGSLQDNGGPTRTHALLPDSPAIDAANVAVCPDRDQRGANRRQGSQWQGAGCDIGAFELPVVKLSAVSFEGLETANPATFTARLDVSLPFALTARFNTVDGLAQAGLDYSAVTGGALTFAPGNTIAVGAVPITANPLYTGDRWLTVALSPTIGVRQGTPLSGTLTLLDAQPPPGAAFTTGAASVLKSAGSVVVTATLDTISGVTATVLYSTTNGTALAGRDYVAKTGAFIFPAGRTVQTTTLALVNDGQYYGDRMFGVTLSQPLSATVGSPGTMAITILDDNPRRVFLPIIMTPYSEREPNDTLVQANGPLERGRAYAGSNKGDFDVDYFFLEAAGSGTISVNVADLISGAQVQVRNSRDPAPLPNGFAGGPPYQLRVTAVQPGRYYILIITPPGYSGGPYALTVTYP